MKLAKETREELREAAAKHKSILIEWPASAPEPEIGRKYPLSSFAPDARLRVERRHKAECESGWEVDVRLDHDPHRLLYGLSPTTNALGDVETEPERVSKSYERQLRVEAHDRFAKHRGEVKAEEDRKAQARRARSELTESLSGLDESARLAFLAEFQRMCRQAQKRTSSAAA